MTHELTGAAAGLFNAIARTYRIERELGAGGMATVYLGEDLKHHRKVAIKVLHAELSAVLGPERFLKEIELTASLQHPHILPLFDSGSADGLLYYVMPFVEGETLRGRLAREIQLPVADAVRIASEVAGALEYAHRRGVVHRDIKPENVLLHDGHALVADFGIALAVEQAGGPRMTQTGLSLGTPQYMSPEQAMGERAITARSDIYSLGAMTYEMLAGAPPFVGPNSQAIVAQVLTTEPTPLSSHRKSVPEHVNFAVRTALEKLPADRFGSAAEFAAALASPATHAQLVTAQAVRRAWWEDRTKLALGAVAVIATAAAAWGWANVAASSRARGLGGSAAAPWLATLEFPDSARPVGPFAISPDGSRLVYVARGPRGMQLWARDAGLLDPRPLAGTDSASYPAISPDGSKIAYLASHALRVVSTAGGLATTVADTLSTFSVIEWSDDEHILMTGQQGIVRVPLHGGAWQRLTTIDTAGGEVFHTAPSRLPGDRAILFTVIPRNYGDDSRFQIAISDPATGHHKILMPGFWARYVEPGYLLVVRPDGVLVAVPFDLTAHRITGPAVPLARQISEETFPAIAVARTGQLVFTAGSGTTTRLSFARVGRGGTATLLDSTWAGSVSEVAASPDGARLASIVNTGTWDVEIRDLHTGGASRIHVTGAVADDPVFSADGRTLFYVTNNPVEGAVYQAAVGSATSPRLVLRDTAMNLWEPAPSPDGRTLYYVKRRGGRSDIYAHALARAGAPDWPLTATTARESSPSPSPDGRWLAYVSDESGRRELYVRSTDSSRAERWTISVNGGASPRWSRDGRELFYVSRDTLMAAEVETAGELSVRSRRALFSLARFSTQRTSYDVLPGTGGFLMLEKRDTTGAAPRIVFVDQWRSLLGQAGESRSP